MATPTAAIVASRSKSRRDSFCAEGGVMSKLGAMTALLALGLLDVGWATPVEACGFPVAIKYSRPRRAAGVAAKPANVLLVGAPPQRLEHDLSSAGHHVEVTPDAAMHKRGSYDIIVVASNEQAELVRSTFPRAAVVVRTGDVTTDVRSIEGEASRLLVRAASGHDVLDAGPKRSMATRAWSLTPTAPEPSKLASAAPPDSEVYFAVGSSALGDKRELDETARWLAANERARATIEGHADPSGTRDWNMTLSQQRAEAVRDYLVTHGIDAARLEIIGYGDTNLKYASTDRRNRRVAVVMKP
jgi:outer membrane protein OmpA-like peptidoglycan-associated protein